jgi:DNA adenine methylase
MTKLTPPLKWHGGKQYLARRIVALMPPHLHYVEPYAGGLAVLLAKDPHGDSEVVNDLHGPLTNFWRVIRNDELFPLFHRRVECIPFSQIEWEDAKIALTGDGAGDRVGQAVAFFVFCRQSMAGRCREFAALSRTRTRRGMNEQASAWISAVDGLPAVHARLRRVPVLCQPALQVIRKHDGPDTLFYCDPPYLHETRTACKVYALEMTEADHRELLKTLLACKGKVMHSGYPSAMYDSALSAWNRHSFDIPNNAAGGAVKRVMQECLWCNF